MLASACRFGPITSRSDTQKFPASTVAASSGTASKLDDRGLCSRLRDPSRGQSSSELGHFLQKLRLPAPDKEADSYSEPSLLSLPSALPNNFSPSALLARAFRLASKQHWKLMLIYIKLACFTSTDH